MRHRDTTVLIARYAYWTGATGQFDPEIQRSLRQDFRGLHSHALVAGLRGRIGYPAQVLLEIAAPGLRRFRLEIVQRHHRGHFLGGGTGDELVHRNAVARE